MESKTNSINSDLKPTWKIVAYLGLLFLGGISVYMLSLVFTDFTYSGEDLFSTFVFLFILISSLLSMAYLYRTRLTIDAEGIENVGLFSSYRIAYPDIEAITFDSMLIHIEGNGKEVSLGNLSNNFEEASAYITEQIGDRSDIEFKVKEKFINKLDTNPLYRFGVGD